MTHSLRSTISHALTVLRLGSCTLALSVPALAQAVEPAPVQTRANVASVSTDDAGREVARPSSTAVRATEFAVPERTQVLYGTSDAGTTWASGASYKASFGPRGATYIPFFGSDAPRNFPIDLTLGRVVAGGVPIDLHPVTNAVRRDDTVTIDRGPIDEVYELALDHVEQRFIVKQRPPAGALDLFVPLSSELELTSHEGNIELRGECGTVNYGRAFARLDDGSRVPLETSVEDGAVRIHIDAEFMAGARFPLVIDPIVSTFTITAFGDFPTISYDADTDRYLIAWRDTFSSTDHDVFWHLRGANNVPVANGVADNSTDDCFGAKAANLNGHDQFLLVFQRKVVNTTAWKIWGRTIQAATAGQSASFLISTDDASGNKIEPDVGGDPYFDDAYYCVVWTRELTGERDIHGRLVRYNTALVGSSTMPIDNTIGAIDRTPAISKSSGQLAAAAWTIVWGRTSPTLSLCAARLSYNGVMVNPPAVLPGSYGNSPNPDVSTPRADGRVCLAYDYSAALRHHVLNGTTIEASGDGLNYWPSVGFNFYDTQASVDSDGQYFVAAAIHDELPAAFFSYFVTLGSSSLSSTVVADGPLELAAPAWAGSRPDVVSHASSGGSAQDFGIVFAAGGIRGVTYHRPTGGPYNTSCTGNGAGNNCPCSNTGSVGHGCANSEQASGALLTATGDAATGAQDTLRFTLSNTPTGSPAILFQGTIVDNTPGWFGDGTLCTEGTITRFAVKFPNGFGLQVWPQVGAGEPAISVQGFVPPAGAERSYQAYYRDSATFCTGSTFNISNGVRVYWLP